MNAKNLKFVIGGLLGLLVIAWMVVVYFDVFSQKADKPAEEEKQEISTDEPIDIVLDFYTEWLEAAKSTSTNPYQLELYKNPIFSGVLRDRLTETLGSGGIDPVLCQTVVPEDITGRVVFALENKAHILVMSRDKAVYEQANVVLNRLNDGWYIDDIVCSPGEFAPVREFSFEKEGFLLKNVPPPLNPEYWYLIFEENREQGHSAPLFLGPESKCIALDGKENVCNANQFREATKVKVYGQMTERGVEVVRLEFAQ